MGRRVRPALAALAVLSLAATAPAVGAENDSRVQLTVRAGGDRVGASDEVLPLAGATYRFFETTPGSPPTGGVLVGECTTDVTGACTVTSDLTGSSSFYVEQSAAPQGWDSSSWRYTSGPVHPRDPADERVLTFPGPDRSFPNLRNTPDVLEAQSLNVAVVYDLSNSVTDHDELMDTYRAAGISLVDAMEGTPSAMAVYTFATSAPAQGEANQTLPLTPLDTDSQTVRDKINSLSATPDPMEGGTNWDMGLAQVNASSYDLVVFLTDGDPTFHRDGRGPGTETTFRQVEEAAHSANTVKSQSSLAAVGVGEAVDDPVSQERLRHLSDLVIVTDFDELADDLIELVPIPEPEPPVDPEPEPRPEPPVEPEPIPGPPKDPAPVEPPIFPVDPPVEPEPDPEPLPEPPVEPAPIFPVDPPVEPEPDPAPGPPFDPAPGRPTWPVEPPPTPAEPVAGQERTGEDAPRPQAQTRVFPLPRSTPGSPTSPVATDASESAQAGDSSLRLTQSVINGEDVAVGDLVTYVMTATNTGQDALLGVTIDMRKDGPGALSDMECTPSAPATLAPGESMACLANYEVTGASVSTSGVLVESNMTDGLVPSRTIEVLGASGLDALVSIKPKPGRTNIFTLVLPGDARFVTDPGPESGCKSAGNRLTCPVDEEEEVFLTVSSLPLISPVVDGQARAFSPSGEVLSTRAVTQDGEPVSSAPQQKVHRFRSMA